jgi:hypothetical protein
MIMTTGIAIPLSAAEQTAIERSNAELRRIESAAGA